MPPIVGSSLISGGGGGSAGGAGDITDVVAGAGLTGGAASGSATVDVGAGTGISVAADSVAVDQTTAFAWTSMHSWDAGSGTNNMTITDATTTTQVDVLKLRKGTSGTAAAGIGAGLTFQVQDAGGTFGDATRIVSMGRAVAAGTINGAMVFQYANNGTLQNAAWVVSGVFGCGSFQLGSIGATGSASATYTLQITGGMVQYQSNSNGSGGHSFVGTPNTSGARQYFVISPSSNTGGTASTEIKRFQYNTYTQTWQAGAIATQREFAIEAPTYAFGSASTVTDTCTLYVSGAPIAGTNATFTRSYALWTDDGDIRHDNIGVALGAGGTATLGAVGGSGPATTTQNKWARINIDGTNYFIPVWV